MTMNPISALTGATCDRILNDPLLNRYSVSIMAEAAAIGERIGCPISQSGMVGVPTPHTDALLGLIRVYSEAHHG
jgi:hypothetical protein